MFSVLHLSVCYPLLPFPLLHHQRHLVQAPRAVLRQQAFGAVTDVPFIALCLACLLFPHRTLSLLRGLRLSQQQSSYPWGALFSLARTRRLVLSTAVALLWDIPCLACLIVVYTTIYRAPYTHRRIFPHLCRCGNTRRSHRGRLDAGREEWQALALEEFREVLLDAPFALAGLFVSVACPWRVYSFHCHLWGKEMAQDCSNRQQLHQKRRRTAAVYLWWLLMDIPATLSAAFVVVTVWRARRMTRGMADLWRSGRKLGWWDSWHWVPMHHCWAIVTNPLEIMSIVCLPVSLWRAPGLLRFIESPRCRTDSDMQIGAITFGFLAISDVAAMLMAVVVLCTGWRTRSLWNAMASELVTYRRVLGQRIRAGFATE